MAVTVQNTVKYRRILDIDYIFVSGTVLPLSLDLQAGDSIVEDDVTVTVNLSGRSSIADPDAKLGPERIVIQKAQLLFSQSREREVSELDQEARRSIQELLADEPATVN